MRDLLNQNNIKYHYLRMKYNYGKKVNLPYTLPKNEQSTNINLDNTLLDRLLDYFFYLKNSVPSLDQLGFGSYVFTGIMKWI